MTDISAADAARIPVIVGVGQIEDRIEDPYEAQDSLGLMRAVMQIADADGGGGWLARLDSLDVVFSMSFADEIDQIHHRLAEALEVSPSHNCQTPDGSADYPVRLLNEAANRIARGESRVAAVVGGEALRTAAMRRKALLAREGAPQQDDGGLLRRRAQSRSPGLYLKYGLQVPTDVYPLYENALRASLGQTFAEAQAETGRIWSLSSQVAAENPHAWIRRKHSAEEIVTLTPKNRPICFPYSKLMVANSSVNMAAGVLITSLAEARARGVPEHRLVYVGAGAFAHESEDRLERERFDQTPSMEVAINRALELNGVSVDDLEHVELYSCFPCMPKLARRILGWPLDRPSTVYGGLTFGGGPIGNCMTHAIAAMTEKLRLGGRHGFIWANGGFATHNHAIVLSRQPRPGVMPQDSNYQAEADARRGEIPELLEHYEGPGVIETYSVPFDRDGAPGPACIVARTPAGARFLARLEEQAGVETLISGTTEPIGLTGTAVMRDDIVIWRPN